MRAASVSANGPPPPRFRALVRSLAISTRANDTLAWHVVPLKYLRGKISLFHRQADRGSFASTWRISMIEQTSRATSRCHAGRRRTDNPKYRRVVVPRGHIAIRRQFILKSRAIGQGLVDLGQAVATLRAVKDSRGETIPRRFSRPRRRGKPKAVENGRRQFYGLAYRSRTGTLFPPALFSLSLRFAPNAPRAHDAIHSLSLPLTPHSRLRSAPLSRHALLSDPIAKLYLYPSRRVYLPRSYERLIRRLCNDSRLSAPCRFAVHGYFMPVTLYYEKEAAGESPERNYNRRNYDRLLKDSS